MVLWFVDLSEDILVVSAVVNSTVDASSSSVVTIDDTIGGVSVIDILAVPD